MALIEIETLGGLKNKLTEVATEGLLNSKGLKRFLNRQVTENWYRKRRASRYYKRTNQLKKSADLQLSTDLKSVDLFLNPSLIEPVKSERPYNSYMNFNGKYEYGGRTVADWVTEWIEEGNIMYAGREITKNAEENLKKENLHEKELVKALKKLGIKAEVV